MSDDHAKRALEILAQAGKVLGGTERGLLLAEAQVYATLALVEVLAPPSPEARAAVRRPAWVDAQRQQQGVKPEDLPPGAGRVEKGQTTRPIAGPTDDARGRR